MTLSELLLDVLDDLPFEAGTPEEGVAVALEQLDLQMPVEAWMRPDGSVAVSPPRGRMRTGFDPDLGRLRVRITRSDA